MVSSCFSKMYTCDTEIKHQDLYNFHHGTLMAWYYGEVVVLFLQSYPGVAMKLPQPLSRWAAKLCLHSTGGVIMCSLES